MTKQIKNTAVLLACALLFGLLPKLTFAQTQVKGIVTDAKGAPLEGASVKVRGEKGGTTTKSDGSFEISLKDGKTLDITDVGYNSQSIKYTGAGSLDVKLTQDSKSLSEVVVTGVGVATSKKKVAFTVETVNLANQVKVATGDVGQQLVGQIAGAQISSTNGSPGAPLNILLRGINSLNKSTSPIILLDGIQIGATDLGAIDVNIIERVEVIQGPAAAMMYGAQGGAGVIQLFTKKAKIGKVNIDFSSSATTNELLNIGGVSKSKFHAFTTNAAGEVTSSGGTVLKFDPILGSYNANVGYSALSATSYAEKPYDKNLQYYDHYKMFLQKGYAFNNSVSISSSKEKSDFLLSVSTNKQNSNFRGNGEFSRSNLTTNYGIELLKNLKFRSITQLIYTKNTLNDPTGRSIFYNLNNTRPFANYDYVDPDGNYGIYVGDAAGVNGSNPNYTNQYSSTLDRKIDIIQNFNLNYKLNKFIELDAKYGLNYQTDELIYRYENQEANVNAEDQAFWIGNNNPNGSAETTGEIDNRTERITYQNFLGTAIIRTDFEKDFNLKIPIKTSTQLTYDYRGQKRAIYSAYGYDAPVFSPWNASQAGVYKVSDDYNEPFATFGVLVNQRFEYGDIAGVSVGFRSDKASTSGRGVKGQTFYRGDAFMNISKLNFWENAGISNIISDFRVRGAFGSAGIQPKPFDRFYRLGSANLGAANALNFPVTVPDPDLTFEVSKEKEFGFDLGFKLLKKGSWLNNLNLAFTYWDRKSLNSIYDVDAAPSTGIGLLKSNSFSLGSNGIQASLNLNVLTNKSFTWDFVTNFSRETSKILSINGQEVVVTSSAGSSNYVLRPGEKIGQLYGFLVLKSVDQLDPNTGQPFILKANQGLYEVASNGYVVNKATKQPVASPGQYSFGDPNPDFNMSFINNFSFKGYLTFNMQWDWIKGSHLYNQTKSWMYRDGISSDYANPITIDGVSHAYTAFYRGIYQAGANNGTKDYFYENSSFLRLRNIAVAFDFAKFFKIKFANRMQLVVSGRNLLTKTKYTGYDPEVSSGSSNSAFDRGVDHNTIPNTKSYTIGLNLGF
jgi:TonB-dependent starch-binding outer membrane protein SusC